MKIVVRQVRADESVSVWTTEVATEEEADSVMKRVEAVIGDQFMDVMGLAIDTTRDISLLWKEGANHNG